MFVKDTSLLTYVLLKKLRLRFKLFQNKVMLPVLQCHGSLVRKNCHLPDRLLNYFSKKR